MTEGPVEVVVQMAGTDVLAGRLWAHRRRGTESQTFAYDASYLARPGAYALDPALPLDAAAHHTGPGRSTFGALSDCAPDRWGRRLAERQERRRARATQTAARTLGEIDHLLRVRDDLRQGALRLRHGPAGPYLAEEADGVPTLLELPELLDLADRVDAQATTDAELAALVRAGSSLGGARPKAHVRDVDGRIAIAKFPSPGHDEWDVMRWEWVALELARRAHLRVPDSALHVIAGRAVHVVDRFDRAPAGRVGYVSAMTLLEAVDGDTGSYLEIAEAIETSSPRPTSDLHELWCRVALSVLITNTDDHLRNHGFLRTTTEGWSLAPLFDVNPVPVVGERHLHTAIDDGETAASIALLMEVADAFRLGAARAQDGLRTVVDAVAGWRATARAAGLSRAEVERMASAFEHAGAEEARALVG